MDLPWTCHAVGTATGGCFRFDYGKNYTIIKEFSAIWQFRAEIAGFFEDFATYEFKKVYMAVLGLKLPYALKSISLCIIFAIYESVNACYGNVSLP